MTRPRSAVPLAVLAAVAILSASLAACGGKDAKPAAAPAAPATAAAAIHDPPSYPCRQVLVSHKGATPSGPNPVTRTAAEALVRAMTILERLKAPGASFADVAKETSDEAATAESGGFVGFLREGPEQPKKIFEAVAALKEGQISDPVETDLGFHLIERLSREEGMRLEAELIAVVSGYFIPWHEIAEDELVTRTKSVAYSEAAAAVAELRAGELSLDQTMERHEGKAYLHDGLHRGGTRKGFETLVEVALSTKVGEYADPVDTPRGWAVFVRQKPFRMLVRHILILHSKSRVDKKLAPKEAMERSPDAAEEIAMKAREEVMKDRSKWAEIVAKYSEEPMSAKDGGSMGDVCNTGPSDRRLEGPLEFALQKLKPGEISKVTPSRVGWHIFWRVD